MKNIVFKYKNEGYLILIWVVVIFIINPIGDFPLNDDWCYAKSVKTLCEDNYLKLYNWGEMTLVGQIYWGYLFTNIFGFSFTVLRFSTLVLALFSFFGLSKLFDLINISKQLSLLGIILCMFNPIFLELSFTYMTDVPFYTLSVFICYYFVKYIKTEKNKYLVFAFLCSALAYSVRQLALVYPLVWTVYYLLSYKFKLKTLFRAFYPLILFVAFSLCFDFVLKSTGIMQERFNSKFYLLLDKLLNFNRGQLIYSINLLLTSLAYLGLFLSPIVLIKIKQFHYNYLRVFTAIYTVVVIYILHRYNYILPSLDNIWIDFGVGPFTLYNDVEVAHFKKTPSPHMFQMFYYALTAIGVFSSSVFFYEFTHRIKTKTLNLNESKPKLFALVFIVVYLTPFLIVGVYDRYLLPLFPMVILFVLDASSRYSFTKRNKIYTLIFTASLIWFSVCATHDYLSWNRTRWQVLNDLTINQKISKNKINGGAEFITWYHFSEEKEKWWESVTPVYVLTVDVLPNDNVVKTFHYSRWLPGKGELFLVYNKHLED